MPVPFPDTPTLLAELARFLEHPQPDQSGAPSLDLGAQLQAAQAWLCQQEADAAGALADFIGALGVRLAQDRLKGRITTQAAQFELLTLRAARAAEETERLSGGGAGAQPAVCTGAVRSAARPARGAFLAQRLSGAQSRCRRRRN
jgi:hypothetical protein